MAASSVASAASSSAGVRALTRYVPPAFTGRLPVAAPPSKVVLAMAPTPIEPWALPRVPAGVEVSIKRDDMTGSTLSGNKVRKLEFIFAEALRRGCGSVITCGGVQSNHARATTVAARQLGLEPHVLLRSRTPADPSSAGSEGNMFCHKMVGAHVHLVEPQPFETGLRPKMEALARELEARSGRPAMLVPVGGSDALGVWGYLDAWEELWSQGVADRFDDVVVAVGSGGTASGLAIGNYLTGSKVRVHAVAVCDDAAYFHGHCNEMIAALGLADETRSEDILDIVEGYKGRGYGLSTPEELAFLREVAEATGIFLDPVYTGKAVLGLVGELERQFGGREGARAADTPEGSVAVEGREEGVVGAGGCGVDARPGRFRGRRVLFVHTGGLMGLMDGRMIEVLGDGKVTTWHER